MDITYQNYKNMYGNDKQQLERWKRCGWSVAFLYYKV